MEITRQLPEPLQWSEGMMLSPQHFQQSDIYWHEMLRHQMAQLQPDYWGLLDLNLDTDEITDGKIGINALQCVMPDGLVVQYPAEGQEEALSVDVSAHPAMQANGNQVKVFVTVPIRTEGAASASAAIQRYQAVRGQTVLDENTGMGTMVVPRLRSQVSLFVGQSQDIPAKYCAVPLFELRKDEAGFHMTAYHPPLLRMEASRFLQEQSLLLKLKKLTRAIRSKARLLAGVEDETSHSSMPINERYREVIRSLVTALPPLEVLVGAGTTHPFEVYKALAALYGQVSQLSPNQLPLPPREYQHDHIEPAFNAIVRSMWSSVKDLHLAYSAMRFEREDSTGNFSLRLHAEMDVSRLVVELRPRPGQNVRQLVSWLKRARIASGRKAISLLAQHRRAGANVRALSSSEVSGLHVSSSSVLFELESVVLEINGQKLDAISNTHTQASENVLFIDGGGLDDAPAAIVLHTPNDVNASVKAGKGV